MNDADKNTIKFVMHKCTGGYEICTGDALELLEIIDRLEAENAKLKAQVEKLRLIGKDLLTWCIEPDKKLIYKQLLAETKDAK